MNVLMRKKMKPEKNGKSKLKLQIISTMHTVPRTPTAWIHSKYPIIPTYAKGYQTKYIQRSQQTPLSYIRLYPKEIVDMMNINRPWHL